MHRLIPLVAAVTALSLVAGCSGGAKTARSGPDYRQASTLPPLEVPPDLTSPVVRGDMAVPEHQAGQNAGAATVNGRAQVLSKKTNLQVMGEGEQRWLVVDAAPDTVWSRVRDFWLKNGFELKIEEPAIGIMETQWAENRADIPESFLRKMIGRVLERAYSAPTRDKFRVRLERTANGKTELYLTHYGVEQALVEQQVGGNEEVLWKRRPSDPELANEMLNRIMVYLGVDEADAETMLANAETESARAELVRSSGEPQVVVRERFARAWRRTGIALDRIGLVVEDRDRSQGIYYVRFVDQVADAGKRVEKGWFSSLFSSDEETSVHGQKARVLVRGDDRESSIALRGADGEELPAGRVETVLKQLVEQLR